LIILKFFGATFGIGGEIPPPPPLWLRAWADYAYFVVLRSEGPSGKCAKLHTEAASNNRDHAPQSLYCLFMPRIYIWALFFAHIPFVVNRTFNAVAYGGHFDRVFNRLATSLKL